MNKNNKSKMSYEEQLTYVVGRAFLRICKSYGLYSIFKNRTNEYIQQNHHSLNDLFKTYAKQTLNELPKLNEHNPYEHVAIYTNKLLHDFVDNGKNPSFFESVGREVFNLASFIMFGQKFLNDMARQPQVDTRSFEAFCQNQYNMVRNSAARGMSFEEFMKTYHDALNRMYRTLAKPRRN